MQTSADFVISKYPNAGLFLVGDANDLKMDSFCSSLKVKQIVKIPTTRGNTSLDVILTNMYNFYNPPSALPLLGGSYHLSILLSPSSNFNHSFSITYGSYRPLQNSGLLSFGMWLNTEDWSDVYSLKNIDEKMALFHKKLIDKYQICFPEKKFKNCSSDKPFINQTIKTLIRTKLKLFKNGKPDEANKLRKSIKREIRKLARSYYKNKVEVLFTNKPKNWYSEVKKLCGRRFEQLNFNLPESPDITANNLNKFLASIVQSLPPLSDQLPSGALSPSLPTVSPSEIERRIQKLRKTSIFPFDIPFPLISAFGDFLSKPLSFLFNKITESGQMPTIWKQGFITPLKKKNGKPGFEGVRPITLTPIFSKLYEGLLADWLKEKILPLTDLKQFGNLKSTSTSHYLVSLIDHIGKILEKPNSWLNLISIDLQKAFDLVNHNILIEKLVNEFNIDPLLVKLVASFLTNRSQVVKYQNHYSNPLPVHNGIPQGTLLGPLLFSVMINSLAKEFPDRWKFVDDLTVVETCFRNLISDPMSILNEIGDEALDLDMTVNPSKSMIMPICFLKSSPYFLNPIPPEISVSSFKLLGVTISSNLKWDIHVNDIIHRANVSIALLKLLNKFSVPPSHSLRIYTSFVRPHLEYACPVWHPGISREESEKIESIQKRALRIIFKEGKVPYSLLLKKASLKTLE